MDRPTCISNLSNNNITVYDIYSPATNIRQIEIYQSNFFVFVNEFAIHMLKDINDIPEEAITKNKEN